MFNRSVSKLIVFSLLSAALMSCGGNAFDDSQYYWKTNKLLDDSYIIGEKLSVPSKALTIGDVSLDSTHFVTYPSGAVNYSDEITLSEAGEYKITFFANFNGRYYSEDEKIIVSDKMLKVRKKSSSFNYQKYTKFGASTDGLCVDLSKKDILSFSGLFDMNCLKSNETLVKGFITPSSQRSADFGKLTFRFTDYRDENVHLDLSLTYFNHPSAQGLSYATAAFNGGEDVGIETATNIHINDGKGTVVPASFTSTENEGGRWGGANTICEPDKHLFNISYDANNKQVWANGNLVSELNNGSYYSSLFEGFPSGKAKLAVFASSYFGSTASFCLTSILGVDLVNNVFVDMDAPYFENSDLYSNMPYARVGADAKYPVPEIEAFDDVCGYSKPSVRVFYNYSSNNPVNMLIEDGFFKTEHHGDYAIEYIATDYFGNSSLLVLFVKTSNNIPKLKVENPIGYKTKYLVGENIHFVEPAISGGSGEYSSKMIVSKGTEEIIVDDFYQFVEPGSYSVKYVALDYICDIATSSYSIEVEASDKPIFNDRPVFPNAYISNATYFVPELFATKYEDSKLIKVPCKVKIEDKNGSKLYETGDTFIPQVANNLDVIKFTFICDNYESPTYEVYGVDAWQGKELDFSKYFVGTGFEAIRNYSVGESSGVKLASKDEHASISFVNALITDNLVLSLANDPTTGKFEKMTISVCDYLNPKEAIAIDIYSNDNDSMIASVTNGGTIRINDYSLLSSKSDKFVVSISNGNSFSINATNIKTEKTIYGEDFNGFSSGKVNFSISFMGAEKDAGIIVCRIGGSFLTGTTDNVKPMIKVVGDGGGRYSLGSTYQSNVAVSNDVLCPYTSVLMTIRDSNGDYLKDVDGLLLKDVDATKTYQFKLSQVGYCDISYTAKEVNWLKNYSTNSKFRIIVDDTAAPTIGITSSIEGLVNKGSIVKFPTFNVLDNVDEEIDVTCTIVDPNGNIYFIDKDASILCNLSGNYYFSIFAQDQSGNFSEIYLSFKAI